MWILSRIIYREKQAGLLTKLYSIKNLTVTRIWHSKKGKKRSLVKKVLKYELSAISIIAESSYFKTFLTRERFLSFSQNYIPYTASTRAASETFAFYPK